MFWDHFHATIDLDRGFDLVYETCIPRQVGLAGSSALITALLQCLIEHYAVGHDVVSLEKQADLALVVETSELKCAAGLQDRVVQAYGGCVFMDFSGRENVYARIGTDKLGRVCRGMWMAFVQRPENSGGIHSAVRSRWLDGDQQVVRAMRQFADLARDGREALDTGDRARFARCMGENFRQRRDLYGDEVIGADNLRVCAASMLFLSFSLLSCQIVDIGTRHGFEAKFSGSGGCCVGLWKGPEDPESEARALEAVCKEVEAAGFVFTMVSL